MFGRETLGNLFIVPNALINQAALDNDMTYDKMEMCAREKSAVNPRATTVGGGATGFAQLPLLSRVVFSPSGVSIVSVVKCSVEVNRAAASSD